MDILRKDITDWLEAKLAAGTVTMAFGAGGVDGDGKVLSIDTKDLELTDPQGEYPLIGYTRVNDTTILTQGRLPAGGIVGVPISQAGLKVDGHLYAVRNFSEKIFEIDEFYDVNIEIDFSKGGK